MARIKEYYFDSENKNRALRQLSRAFKACRKSGLIFYGMDSELQVFERRAYEKALKENGDDPYEAQRACEESDTVDTHDTYKDSGGW